MHITCLNFKLNPSEAAFVLALIQCDDTVLLTNLEL